MGPGGDQQFFLQFITRYFHYSGTQRCRVTTLARQWTGDDNVHDIIAGFDQEAACALMARVAAYKMEVEEDFDATRWVTLNLKYKYVYIEAMDKVQNLVHDPLQIDMPCSRLPECHFCGIWPSGGWIDR